MDKVLIAEDNEFNQKLMSIVLKKIGLEYDIANNGQEALEKIEENEYSLFLTDLDMPIMDGITAISEIRKLPTGKGKIPILVITADISENMRDAAIEVGANAYLTKPVSLEKLKNIIKLYK